MLLDIFQYKEPFTLESGVTLPGFHLAYHTWGTLNENCDNVVWVFHALTANSNPHEWWPGIVGHDRLFSPDDFFIICVNMPGSCYGSISPLDVDIHTGKPFYHSFPPFTTRDMIRSYQYLREALNIRKIKYGIGGSMGGQQLLQWAIEEPTVFETIIPIATNACHSQWGIAYNESQRWAIEADATWITKSDKAGLNGMKIARSIALLSYRNYSSYSTSLQESVGKNAITYQRYQGEKLARRFNAFSYHTLTKSMDSHNVKRAGLTISQSLQLIQANCHLIGISSDILFPVSEQKILAETIAGSTLDIIDSLFGHDGFLIESEAITDSILKWQSNKK
jgi:homoserine O-acetyltransferase